MDHLERQHIYSGQPQLAFYARYVDNTGTTVRNTKDAEELLTDLNSKHPTIRFELELPATDGFLPILDIKVQIEKEGHVERKQFTKSANKGLSLHFESHHPHTLTQAVILNEFKRAYTTSTPSKCHSSHPGEAPVQRIPSE